MTPTIDTKYWKVINTLIAMIITVAVFAVPISYYKNNATKLNSEVIASLKHGRYQLEQIVNKNPDFWQYEIDRMKGILQNLQSNPKSSIWSVKDNNSKVLLEINPYNLKITKPSIIKSISITDSYQQVARIEVEISIFHEMIIIAMLTIFSIIAGLIAYFGIVLVPVRAMKKLWNQMAYQAQHDELTGLANRNYFYKVLTQRLANSRKYKTEVAVLSIDLDHFKDVNDTLGHAAGDQLLQKVVIDFQSIIGKRDVLSRQGGDEFSIILTGKNIPDYACMLADKIIEKLSQPYEIDGSYVYIGASIGIAIAHDDKSDETELLKQADIALYEAKNEGRNTFCIFKHKMNKTLIDRKTLEEKLRVAIENEEFELHFQPQFKLASHKIIGVEALIRWQHALNGFIPPTKFIPVAEKAGLIIDIDNWVLLNACKQVAKWNDVRVAVNISPMHFHNGNLLKDVKFALEQSGLSPDRLELEITEGVLMHETDKTIKVLKALKDLGVRIAMDDFGTGYSSLSYLQRFPFDKIKIDRSFISSLSDKEPESKAIIRAIISMSHTLNMRVNAEGVETSYQANFLSSIDCDEVQGFYFGQPLNAHSITNMLKENQNHHANVTPIYTANL